MRREGRGKDKMGGGWWELERSKAIGRNGQVQVQVQAHTQEHGEEVLAMAKAVELIDRCPQRGQPSQPPPLPEKLRLHQFVNHHHYL